MSTIIESIEQRQLRQDLPLFKAGDTVRVHFRVIEGTRSRLQVFEGVVIKRQGSGVRETFTVRKQSFGVGVERTFPVHSPKIERIEVGVIGDVRHSGLEAEPAGEVYINYLQNPPVAPFIAIRTTGEPADLADRVRSETRALDPTLAIYDDDQPCAAPAPSASTGVPRRRKPSSSRSTPSRCRALPGSQLI